MSEVLTIALVIGVITLILLAATAFSLLMLVGIRSLWRDLRDG